MKSGDTLTVASGTQFMLESAGSEPFEAFVCVKAGARARVEGGEPFSPPWSV